MANIINKVLSGLDLISGGNANKKGQGAAGFDKKLIFTHLHSYLSKYHRLNKAQTLLDYGAGFDGYCKFYKDYVGRCIAVDVEDYSKHYTGVDFVAYDGNIMPVADNSVDIVVSHSVLEHVYDIEQSLIEINRVLKVNGIAYLTINPLYYSPWGSHLFDVGRNKLDNWQHLDPSSPFYLIDNPLPDAPTTGHYLNKLTCSEFLQYIGNLPWSIVRFDKIISNKSKPNFIDGKFKDCDLLTEDFKFIGIKQADMRVEFPKKRINAPRAAHKAKISSSAPLETFILADGLRKSAGLAVWLKSGWHEFEIDPAPSRWIGQEALIEVKAESAGGGNLRISLASFCRPRTIQVFLNKNEVFRGVVGVNGSCLAIELDLQAGVNELCLTSLEGAEVPAEILELASADLRPLSFHIRGLEIV